MEENNTIEPIYKETKKRITAWLSLHKGESFDLDLVCRQCELTSAQSRNYASTMLSKEVDRGSLEKINKLYRYIDNTYKPFDFLNASDAPPLDIRFPVGADGSRFGFDGHAVVSPGDIIVVAGVSNMGKTTFALDFLWQNMDNYPCFFMGNELFPAKFKRRISRMTWNNPLREDGTLKFDITRRLNSWKDIIKPDHINIIDWINLDDNFYKIGSIIEGIQDKLHSGIALINLQKDGSKALGLGGGFSEHLASLYLTIDFNRLTVRKLKEWKDINTNGKVFGFEITTGGTQFNNIRPLIKCPDCHGWGKVKNLPCDNCNGSGWADVVLQIPKTDYVNDVF
jgi:hypothetical protein